MSDHAVKELVIVRHRGDDHGEGHHGGVWKIAFADFMTAMMAFFLVMWLINASNEATKKAVASYFNPIKLADVTSNPKGVQDPRYGASSQDSIAANYNDSNSVEKKDDAKPEAPPRATRPGAMSAELSVARESEALAVAASAPVLSDRTAGNEGLVLAEGVTPAEVKFTMSDGQTSNGIGQKDIAKQTLMSSGHTSSVVTEESPSTARSSPSTVKEQVQIKANREAADIRKSLDQEMGPAMGKLGPMLSVKVVSDGILISLTDQLALSMFQVGSSVPNAAMVEATKAVGRVLAHRSGPLVIRGHTDGRQYRSGANDNWRLSSERAHVAFENLIKAGVDDRRVERIEGVADRSLLKADDPLASENRRIEILLRSSVQP